MGLKYYPLFARYVRLHSRGFQFVPAHSLLPEYAGALQMYVQMRLSNFLWSSEQQTATTNDVKDSS